MPTLNLLHRFPARLHRSDECTSWCAQAGVARQFFQPPGVHCLPPPRQVCVPEIVGEECRHTTGGNRLRGRPHIRVEYSAAWLFAVVLLLALSPSESALRWAGTLLRLLLPSESLSWNNCLDSLDEKIKTEKPA